MGDYKICRHPYAEQCFCSLKASSKGKGKVYCTLLNETKFQEGMCPFWKTKEENLKQREQCENRAKTLEYYAQGEYKPIEGDKEQ